MLIKICLKFGLGGCALLTVSLPVSTNKPEGSQPHPLGPESRRLRDMVVTPDCPSSEELQHLVPCFHYYPPLAGPASRHHDHSCRAVELLSDLHPTLITTAYARMVNSRNVLSRHNL